MPGPDEMPPSDALRKLAAWYRQFAEQAGNPVIWEGRLRMAEELEAKADPIDPRTSADPCETGESEEQTMRRD
jgi:hypothetical protein